MNLPPINQLPLTVGQRSLLRAARLIHHAHDEARQDTIRAGGVFPSWLEQDCATLLLLAVTPLPEGLRISRAGGLTLAFNFSDLALDWTPTPIATPVVPSVRPVSACATCQP